MVQCVVCKELCEPGVDVVQVAVGFIDSEYEFTIDDNEPPRYAHQSPCAGKMRL